ncbi:MAG: 30S ribosomal protein S15 [Flavobacteriales bacterium]|nr:30S ribosomal protein S15 [Flavobacteriales bacterium]|tara:strand:+ start:34172 stop:34441 length:270 start_codon:yes stop_codon:yes gene_type:complete
MYLDSNKKKTIFKKYGDTEKNTGKSESQIAIFTERINHLTNYLKENKKDKSTKKSLVLLVGKRRRMLEYLKNKDIARYREIVKSLKLRK